MDKNEVLQLLDEIQEIYNQHKGHFQEEFEAAEKTVVREEYASESSLARGYYCPSITEDVVVGNVKRGRLYKRKPKETPAFRYGFDAQNRLVTVRERFNNEYILYTEDAQIGIYYNREFDDRGYIRFCRYKNGRLDLYANVSFWYDEGINEADLEQYYLQGGKFCSNIYMYSNLNVLGDLEFLGDLNFLKAKDTELEQFRFRRYVFETEDGMLKRYRAEEYQDGKRIPRYDDGHYYTVGIKRRSPYADVVDEPEEEETDGEEAQEQESMREKLQVVSDHLRLCVKEGLSLSAIVDSFIINCGRFPFEDEMRLYETGVFSFSGPEMFYFNLVRQFPSEDGEYLQLTLSVLYPPTEKNRTLEEAYWDEELDGTFFSYVKSSKAYRTARKMDYERIEISLEET